MSGQMDVSPDEASMSDYDRGENMASKKSAGMLKRFGPLVVVLLGIGAFFATGLDQYLTFSALSAHYVDLTGMVDASPVVAAVGFTAVYAVFVALSLPAGSLLTIAAGLLFGVWFGTLFALIGATIGSVAVFLVARSAAGDMLRRKAGPTMAKLQDGFKEDAFNYLLVLRLVPAFPFWLVNIVPAVAGVGLRTYTVATAIGIIPGTLVFANIGDTVDGYLAAGVTPDPAMLTDTRILVAIGGLGLLALIPVAYRRYQAMRAKRTPTD